MLLWLIFTVNSTLYESLAPGEVANLNEKIKQDENIKLTIKAFNLTTNKKYECRVSWPSTSPIKIYFDATSKVSDSDEKIVFVPKSNEEEIRICIRGIGVSSNRFPPNYYYDLPINISLDQQYFGLTWSVWKLIIYLLPICLAVSLFYK